MSPKPNEGTWHANGWYIDRGVGPLFESVALMSAYNKHRVRDSHMIAEAGNVFNETGQTPRQLQARIDELFDALLIALPYVEDALDDPAFKKGVVKKHAKLIRDLVS